MTRWPRCHGPRRWPARPDIGPLYYEPTVLEDVTRDMRACIQETFGPVVSLYKVQNDEEAIDRANDTEYPD